MKRFTIEVETGGGVQTYVQRGSKVEELAFDSNRHGVVVEDDRGVETFRVSTGNENMVAVRTEEVEQ